MILAQNNMIWQVAFKQTDILALITCVSSFVIHMQKLGLLCLHVNLFLIPFLYNSSASHMQVTFPSKGCHITLVPMH